MANKTSFQTFATLENSKILSIELQEPSTNNKVQSKFIKLFPSESEDASTKKEETSISGSGFFITKEGIIATNAHLVKDALSINISFSNDIGTFNFLAQTLLIDNKNDVALLEITDEEFNGFNSIPYCIADKAEVGEKVFTIGFPLFDLMGNNYKVTDGIISSNSGIADDDRYFQISVPLQPGNSGGPLYNLNGNIIGITTARLNEDYVGTQIENVNYAIKSTYLLNLYYMLPNKTELASASQLDDKELQDLVKILKDYVCLITISK